MSMKRLVAVLLIAVALTGSPRTVSAQMPWPLCESVYQQMDNWAFAGYSFYLYQAPQFLGVYAGFWVVYRIFYTVDGPGLTPAQGYIDCVYVSG